jgi:4-hydroxybenzoate polyprenyltransferase
MTKNWLLLIIWLLVAAMSLIEFGLNLTTKGWSEPKTWFFLSVLIVAFVFVFRHRKLRNKEKIDFEKKQIRKIKKS